MHKKELKEAIQGHDHKKLKDFLLTLEPVYVNTYLNHETNTYHQVWVGDYVFNLCKKKKILESELKSLLLLAGEKGETWISYITAQPVCLTFLKMLSALVDQELLSSQVCLDLLLHQQSDGWTVISRMAKYQKADCLSLLFKLLTKLTTVKISPIAANDIKQGLLVKIVMGSSFFHCLAQFQVEATILEFIEFYKSLDKELNNDLFVKLCSLTTDKASYAHELLIKRNFTGSIERIVTLLAGVYSQSPELLPTILKVLSDGASERTIINHFLETAKIAHILPLLKEIYQKDPANVSAILKAFIAKKTSVGVLFLKDDKNIDCYNFLIKIFSGPVLSRQDVDISNYRTFFLGENQQSIEHLYLIAKGKLQSYPETFAAIFNMLQYLSIQPVDILIQKIDDWSLFHIAARFLSEKEFNIFNNFFFESLIQSLNSLESINKILLMLLELPNENKPNFILLLSQYQTKSFIDVLDKIKNHTLDDSTLQYNLLKIFYFYYQNIKKIVDIDFEKLKAFINMHLEKIDPKILGNDDDLDMIQLFHEEGLGAANFILYRYYKPKKDPQAQSYFDAALKSEYPLALLERSLQDLKATVILDKYKFYKTFCKKFKNVSEFVLFVDKQKQNLTDDDYMLLLQHAIYLFDDNNMLRFTLGKFCDGLNIDNAKAKAKIYFDAIPQNQATLSAPQHQVVCSFYRSLYSQSAEIHALYSFARHYYICSTTYQVIDPVDQKLYDENVAKRDDLLALYQLENKLYEKFPNYKTLASKLKMVFLNKLANQANNQPADLKLVCTTLSGWLDEPNVKGLDLKFVTFKKEYTNGHNAGFFGVFNGNQDILSIIDDFYHHLKSPQKADVLDM